MVPRLAALFMLAASLMFGVVGTSALHAQDTAPGRVIGVVSDSASGQPLQSGQLFLSRGTTRLEARTNADGRFTFPAVPAGSYGFEAIRLGFRRVVRAGIAVSAGATLTYDVKMNAAALNLQAMVTTGVVDPASGTRVPFSPEGTPIHFPIPGREPQTLRPPLYTFGGPGGQGSAPARDPARCPVALARCAP